MILTKVDTRTDPALAPDRVIENIPSLLQNYCRRFFSRALWFLNLPSVPYPHHISFQVRLFVLSFFTLKYAVFSFLS